MKESKFLRNLFYGFTIAVVNMSQLSRMLDKGLENCSIPDLIFLIMQLLFISFLAGFWAGRSIKSDDK